MVKNEKELVMLIAEKLEDSGHFKKIYPNVNLASRKFYNYWKEWFPSFLSPLAQPEIDLLLVDTRYDLLAMEVKYFRFENSRLSYSFYEGIGEALALLRFGFTCVSLWQCFEDKTPFDYLRTCALSAWDLIGALDFPINYEALRIVKVNQEVQFHCIAPNSLSFNHEIPELPSPYGKSNPLCSRMEVKKMRDFLKVALKIPSQ